MISLELTLSEILDQWKPCLRQAGVPPPRALSAEANRKIAFTFFDLQNL